MPLDKLQIWATSSNATLTTYDNEWIPIMLADKSTQATISSERTKENDWKASEPLYDFAEATDRVTKTVTPDPFERKNETTQYNIFEQDLLPEAKDSTKAPLQDNDLKGKLGCDSDIDNDDKVNFYIIRKLMQRNSGWVFVNYLYTNIPTQRLYTQ